MTRFANGLSKKKGFLRFSACAQMDGSVINHMSKHRKEEEVLNFR